MYFVSSCGEVINRRGKRLKGELNSVGYRRVNLSGKRHFIHRLVATEYIPNPDNLPVVNHIDGDRTNNRSDNLEWCTRSYNVQDGWNRGRRSENRYSEDFEEKIYQLWLELGVKRHVAKALGIDPGTVLNVVKRRA